MSEEETQRECPWCQRPMPCTFAFCSHCGTSLIRRPHTSTGAFHLYADAMRLAIHSLENLLALDAEGEALLAECENTMRQFQTWRAAPPSNDARSDAIRRALSLSDEVEAYADRKRSFRTPPPRK